MKLPLTDKAFNQEPADWTITAGCRPFHHCACCVVTHHRQQQQQREADFKLKKAISTQTYRPVIAAICSPIFVSTEFLKEENEKQSSKTKTASWRKRCSGRIHFTITVKLNLHVSNVFNLLLWRTRHWKKLAIRYRCGSLQGGGAKTACFRQEMNRGAAPQLSVRQRRIIVNCGSC